MGFPSPDEHYFTYYGNYIFFIVSTFQLLQIHSTFRDNSIYYFTIQDCLVTSTCLLKYSFYRIDAHTETQLCNIRNHIRFTKLTHVDFFLSKVIQKYRFTLQNNYCVILLTFSQGNLLWQMQQKLACTNGLQCYIKRKPVYR